MRSLALLLLVACNGGPGPDDDTGDVSGPFASPADFDHSDCEAGSLAGLDPVGVWNAELRFPSTSSVFTWRIDSAGGGYEARMGGWPADISLTDDDLFLRREIDDGELTYVLALDGCRLDGDVLSGGVASCAGDGCLEGTFEGLRIERLPGEGVSDGIDLLGQFSGSDWSSISANVRVKDGIAYIARYYDGLRIVDVSDPSDMSELAHLPALSGELINDLKLVENPSGDTYALLGSNDRGVVVVDVSDPSDPVEVTTFPEEGANVHTLFTETDETGTVAWIAHYEIRGVSMWDVTDPANPFQITQYVRPGAPDSTDALVHDLFVQDGRVYLNYWGYGLVVVDTWPEPELVGVFDDYSPRKSHSGWVTDTLAGPVYVHGDEGWGAHLRTIDADESSEGFLTELGAFQTRTEVSVHNIMAFDGIAYVAWYQDGLRLLDLSDPTSPEQIAYYNTWDGSVGWSFYEGAIGLDVHEGLIYVVDTNNGLFVLKPTTLP